MVVNLVDFVKNKDIRDVLKLFIEDMIKDDKSVKSYSIGNVLIEDRYYDCFIDILQRSISDERKSNGEVKLCRFLEEKGIEHVLKSYSGSVRSMKVNKSDAFISDIIGRVYLERGYYECFLLVRKGNKAKVTKFTNEERW